MGSGETVRPADSEKATDETMILQGGSSQQVDDLLTLGNTTIQSLSGVLDMEETTIPGPATDESLSQLEKEVLDGLGTRLDRLRSSIHDTRNGITKLEYQMSQASSSVTGSSRIGLHLDPANDSNQQSNVEAGSLQSEEQKRRWWVFNWW